MTEQFKLFLKTTNEYLNSDNFNAEEYCDYVEQFWMDHELDLEYDITREDYCDENTVVSKIWELADRYDLCDEIVRHDPYCINELTLKSNLKEIIGNIQY